MLLVRCLPARLRHLTTTLSLCALAVGGTGAADAVSETQGGAAAVAAPAAHGTAQGASAADTLSADDALSTADVSSHGDAAAAESPEAHAISNDGEGDGAVGRAGDGVVDGSGVAEPSFGETIRDLASPIHPLTHPLLQAQNSPVSIEGRACALSARAFARRQAVLRVLCKLYSLSRQNRYRRSPEIWAACAQTAEELHCPSDITALLRRLSEPVLAPHHRRLLLQQLDRSFERERLNTLALRQYIELLPEEGLDLAENTEQLPLGALFLRTELPVEGRSSSPERPKLPTTNDLIATAQQSLEALNRVSDRNSADEAARTLMTFLLLRTAVPQREEIAPRRLTADEIEALERSENLTRELRRRLRQMAGQEYFGSPNLARVACLLDVL